MKGRLTVLVSIVVPCFNEGKNIYNFHAELEKVLHPYIEYELILVNDGSKDDTQQKMQELAQIASNVFYISFSRNFGKEAAMLAGLQYAKGEAVIIMDGDLQHPPALIPQMIKKYEEGYEQVIAKRNRKGDSFVRSKISSLYYVLINRLVDVQLQDGVGDFRLLSRRVVDALLSLKEYNRFSKGLFSWVGFKEAVIEYENVTRDEGSSSWTFPKLLNYGIDGLISFNNKPLRASIYMGMALTSLSLIYVLFTLIQIIFKGIDVPGYFTIISSILIVGGVQLIFLGVIGEYIGRIFYETKSRPHYLISETNLENAGIKEYSK